MPLRSLPALRFLCSLDWSSLFGNTISNVAHVMPHLLLSSFFYTMPPFPNNRAGGRTTTFLLKYGKKIRPSQLDSDQWTCEILKVCMSKQLISITHKDTVGWHRGTGCCSVMLELSAGPLDPRPPEAAWCAAQRDGPSNRQAEFLSEATVCVYNIQEGASQ